MGWGIGGSAEVEGTVARPISSDSHNGECIYSRRGGPFLLSREVGSGWENFDNIQEQVRRFPGEGQGKE